MKIKWEQGFKRVTWVISSIGLLCVAGGLIVATIYGIKFAIEVGEIPGDFRGMHVTDQEKFIREAEARHPELANQKHLSRIEKVIYSVKRGSGTVYFAKKTALDSLGVALFGSIWFGVFWGGFLLIRWIVKGFT